jgi:hypothetical protein
MKRALIGLAALPLFTGGAWAANVLTEPQLEIVTAGATPIVTPPLGLLPAGFCNGCESSSSSSSSSNGNDTSSNGGGPFVGGVVGGGVLGLTAGVGPGLGGNGLGFFGPFGVSPLGLALTTGPFVGPIIAP